jgi:hypothetical protein
MNSAAALSGAGGRVNVWFSISRGCRQVVRAGRVNVCGSVVRRLTLQCPDPYRLAQSINL